MLLLSTSAVNGLEKDVEAFEGESLELHADSFPEGVCRIYTTDMDFDDDWITDSPNAGPSCVDGTPTACRPQGWTATSCISGNNCCMKITAVIPQDHAIWLYPAAGAGEIGKINVTVKVKPEDVVIEDDETENVVSGGSYTFKIPNDADEDFGYNVSCKVVNALPYPQEYEWKIGILLALKF